MSQSHLIVQPLRNSLQYSRNRRQ